MSFDIHFLERPADDNWNAAMVALESGAETAQTLSAEQLATWEQIKSSFGDELPGAAESIADDYRELDDVPTGLQLTMFPTQISLSVPYWAEDEPAAEQIVGLLRSVTEHVERITGLVGFDPQSDCVFLDSRPRQAVDTFDQIRVVVDEQFATPAATEPRVQAPKRRWWQRVRD